MGAGPEYSQGCDSGKDANQDEDHTGDPGPSESLFCRGYVPRKDGVENVHQTTNHKGDISPDPTAQAVGQDVADDDQQDAEGVLFSPVHFHKITSRRGAVMYLNLRYTAATGNT